MNYPPAVHHSRVVRPPRTPQKPTQEKGHLAGPAGPLALQGVEHEENPAGINDHQHQLTNMFQTEQGASPHLCHPCTCLTGPPPCRKSSLPLLSGDHMICSPLPLDSISWTRILPAVFPYHPLPCTMVHPTLMITCCIITRR